MIIKHNRQIRYSYWKIKDMSMNLGVEIKIKGSYKNLAFLVQAEYVHCTLIIITVSSISNQFSTQQFVLSAPLLAHLVLSCSFCKII